MTKSKIAATTSQLKRQPIQPIRKTAGNGKRIWPVV